MKVLFWLRRNRTNKAGTAPVMCRITVEGSTPVQFSNVSSELKMVYVIDIDIGFLGIKLIGDQTG
jgi:hypothetical protein